MNKATTILAGTIHEVPTDLKEALLSSPDSIAAWNGLTPLARNEWICWIITVKQEDTRAKHIQRTIIELRQGKRRPCCWLGCIHRTDKAVSPSVRGILQKHS
ncbi:YdeI/OmpD-associated family protein [Candidatus Saccharibacteria bacterium]|nr:YdeI/OmpD-associated family protein [Candidatus Saccharibacteria bacterium]